MTGRFRCYGILGHFLPRERRGQWFVQSCARAATLKNAIEALGVPHTEIGRVTVNGMPASPDRLVRNGDAIEVYPWTVQPLPDGQARFAADAHLGGLARFLRMLGFDTWHERAPSDSLLRRLAHEQRRVLLTRDRELLKCRDVLFGCYVHERKPEAQLVEVVVRFELATRMRAFSRCLACNVPLRAATREDARRYAPQAELSRYVEFRRCPACERVYWPGSHYARMQAALGRLLG